MTRIHLVPEFDTLQREMNQWLGHFAGCSVLAPEGRRSRQRPSVVPWHLRAEDDHYVLEALLPGIDPQQLEITVQDNTLTVAGTRRSESPTKAQWHRREREGGPFRQIIELPGEIDPDQIKAECRHGILTVTLAKAASAKPRRIEIKAA